MVGGTYHCISRCVRRESLIGSPERCAWIVARLERLVSVFAIDVCDFAVMRNHVHLLLRTHPELAMAWSDGEVARRWLSRPDASREELEADVAAALEDPALVGEWRWRLSDLGWFHKLWKEPAAKAWNREDEVSGHFWEGRYVSLGCGGDGELLMQATYILLNPVHCGAERELGDSPRTSMGRRLRALERAIAAGRCESGVDAYRLAVLEPALPCDPGPEAPSLADGEWSRRLAERTYERALREVAAEEARLAADAARRCRPEALEAAAAAAGVRRRPADEATPPEPNRSSRRARLRSAPPKPAPRTVPSPPWVAVAPRENPWRGRAALPMAEGCTLLAFVEFADDRARVVRADKPGHVDPSAPRVVSRLLGETSSARESGTASRRRVPRALAAAMRLLTSADDALAAEQRADREGPRPRDGPDGRR